MTNGSDLDGGEGVGDGEEEVVEACLLLGQRVQLSLQAGLLVPGKGVHVISELLLLVVEVELLVVEAELLHKAELLLQAAYCVLPLIE